MDQKRTLRPDHSSVAMPVGVAGPGCLAAAKPEKAQDVSTHVADFGIGDVVRHRLFPFRGVVFDVDPQFANTDEWWEAIPEEVRPAKDQPFYHLLAENDEGSYIAYVSQQNLETDEDGEEVAHPAIPQIFEAYREGRYILRPASRN